MHVSDLRPTILTLTNELLASYLNAHSAMLYAVQNVLLTLHYYSKLLNECEINFQLFLYK